MFFLFANIYWKEPPFMRVGFCSSVCSGKKTKREDSLVFMKFLRISRPWANLFEDVRHIRKWPRCLLCAWAYLKKNMSKTSHQKSHLAETTSAVELRDFQSGQQEFEVLVKYEESPRKFWNLPLKYAAL